MLDDSTRDNDTSKNATYPTQDIFDIDVFSDSHLGVKDVMPVVEIVPLTDVKAGCVCLLCGMTSEIPINPNCRHDGLKLEVGEKNERTRSHTMNVVATPQVPTLEVIGGTRRSHRVVIATTKIIEDPCARHKNFVLDVYPDATLTQKLDKQDEILNVQLAAHEKFGTDWGIHPSLFWPNNPSARMEYTINATTCNGIPLESQVWVWPDAHWEFGVKLVLGAKRAAGSRLSKAPGRRSPIIADSADKESHNGIVVKGSVSFDERTFNLEGQRGVWEKLPALEVVRDNIESGLLSKIKRLIVGEVEVEFLNLGFDGKWGWEEIRNSPRCGFAYNFSVGFNPLLKLTGTFDILGGLLNLGGPLGMSINLIRKTIEPGDGSGVAFRIDFIMSGQVSGTLNFEKKAEEDRPVFNGKVGGQIEFSLEGKATIKIDIVIVNFGSELRVGGKVSVEGESVAVLFDGVPGTKGSITFNGLVVYGVLVKSSEVELTSKRPVVGSRLEAEEGKAAEFSSEKSLFREVLIPPKTLMEDGKWSIFG